MAQSSQENTNISLEEKINKVKENILKSQKTTHNNGKVLDVKPLEKSELTDKGLITNIDDYDKNEWINLRTSYANKLYWLLVGEIIGLFGIIVFIGLEKLKISDTTLEVTIIAVLIQTFFLVKEIVTNLFKKNSE